MFHEKNLSKIYSLNLEAVMPRLIILVFLALLIALPAFAQEVGSVSGTVSDADGAGVIGVPVVITGMPGGRGERPFMAETETGENGAFAFDEIPAGWYTIMAGERGEGMAMGRLEVVAGENTEIDLAFGGGGDDDRGGGDDDRGGRGGGDDDRGGRGGGDDDRGGRGGDDEERGFGSVSGTVSTEDGELVTGAFVLMFGNERQELTTETDENGAFAFDEVPAGWQPIFVRHELGGAQSRVEVIADENVEIDLVIGERGGDDDRGGRGGRGGDDDRGGRGGDDDRGGRGGDDDRGVGSVTGTVSTEHGEPVAGAIVVLDGGRGDFQTRTDENGAFGFRPVPAGGHFIEATHRELGIAASRLEVVAGENTEIDLVLGERGGDDDRGGRGGDDDRGGRGGDDDRGGRGGNEENCGSVSGTVTANGEVVERAFVQLFAMRGDRPIPVGRALTDAEGFFGIRPVRAGAYHITAELENHGVAEADIEVVAGENTVIDLELGEGEIGGQNSVGEQDANIPVTATLLKSFPNPFNSVTTVDFYIDEAGYVNLSVYNTAGQLIQTLSEGMRTAGAHQTAFNGLSHPVGTYILRLEAGEQTRMIKLLLLK